MVASFVHAGLKTGTSAAPGAVVLAFAPQALPAVVDQLAAAAKLPPGGPTQYFSAARLHGSSLICLRPSETRFFSVSNLRILAVISWPA